MRAGSPLQVAVPVSLVCCWAAQLPRNCRHMRVLIATRGNCHEKRISYAEQDGIITLTELQGLSGFTQQESKHHLLRLLTTIKVRARAIFETHSSPNQH